MGDSSQDIRWKQRFENFSKSMIHLENALKIESPDFAQKAGIIQFFEMSFELSWKMIKDYLEAQGFTEVKSPRTAIKKAFEIDIIQNGHHWMDLLIDRNLMAHVYDDLKASEIDQLIRAKYIFLLKELHISFKLKIDAN